MMNRRNLLLGSGSAILTSALPARAGIQTVGGTAFGSWWRAVLPVSMDARELKAALEAVIASVNNSMSPFKTTSEISLLNSTKDTNWHSVSEGAEKVIAESLRIARLTEGAFDPTVGPIVGRYGFGPITGASMAGYKSIQLAKGKLRKIDPNSSLDLCGIAKGRALDRMANLLTSRGTNSFLIEAGGEVLARGFHPDDRQWRVAIETPGVSPRAFQCVVKLDAMALATSGNTVNGGQEGGVSFSHIIDPNTKLPIGNKLASVSVIAESAMTADALATAFMVMGSKLGLALAEREDIAAIFLTHDQSGISEITSGKFARYRVA